MKKNEEIFLNLLFTAIRTGAFPSIELSHQVLLSFFDEQYQREAKNDLRKKHEGISKEQFDKINNGEQEVDKVGNQELLIEEKIDALLKYINRYDLKDFEQERVSFDLLDSIKEVEMIFQFYINKTGQMPDKPVKVLTLPETQLYDISSMVTSIANDILLLEVMQDIKRRLLFEERYNPTRKKVVNKPADACHEIVRKYNKEQQVLSEEKLLSLVENDYIIKLYEDSSTKERKIKLKKAVNSWYKDAKWLKKS